MFKNSVLLAVLGAVIYTADAFAPAGQLNHALQSVSTAPVHHKAQSVSLAATDDLVIGEEDSTEPAPEDFIVNAGDLDDEPASDEAEVAMPTWFQLSERLVEVRTQNRRHETDTGSPEFQVAGMTERITFLTKHMQQHPRDFSTRRGLVALVNKRRRLLNYLFSQDVTKYKDLVGSLGIRHKAPSVVLSKDDLYGRFPAQKPNKYANKN
uniref:30S ribosomal protein S15 n=1 Tax=Eucampia antarctica TaxID=49252 RepID=A0A7S2VYQ4_9STRA|mmetsp:Transcript_135/g.130  ORF Transcript_135/g.130 Transcript_135/m.130 type:complete len:209 (+) Transcript_135:99-725(+)|eukprot:CAMPEP_0197823036 /NCGR_PEP_ID=MMETSP1437-20131217/355_1 /TAXON_ID=49252 ORGANISM="Eucampia antarctica, Strain CCMP1452" /NCGR_SAMPLE_ID=MMETSP1437 /ASSEMBLY_ACC=CAM_ASM_001096 /LENGTH=208 /DNA_ID=CAMNT_0043421981 /DNA_START=93 /DNA_END=719 /DNA_ORIENTATION=+